VVTLRAFTFAREQLLGTNATRQLSTPGFEFPLLVRAPDFHMGQNFVLVDAEQNLSASLAELPGGKIIVMEYLDGSAPDGNICKYRVLIVGEPLYPVHLAIARHWKVHYFSADMADHAEHRAKESRFLCDMEGMLGTKAMKSLQAIQETLKLDYGGIDFGLNARGEMR